MSSPPTIGLITVLFQCYPEWQIELLKKALSVNHDSDKFEIVEISDISSGDYSQHLRGEYNALVVEFFASLGVRAIIHAVAPLSGRTDPETTFMMGYSAPVRAGI